MSYDVFISFKNSGKDGKPTPDAAAARSVYQELKSAGIRVFFSEESLADEGRGHFSKSIEKALESSRVLILVASCREHIESQWVEAEWDSFAQDIRSGNKTGELFIYNCGALKPNNLPLFLRRQQMFDQAGLGKLVKFVSSALPTAPTLDSYVKLSLHSFHPEKNEDKVYLVTMHPGTGKETFNVTAHWGPRTAKRLNSQVKAINADIDTANAEIEKARQEKARGGYTPAKLAKLLTDDARVVLSASLGLQVPSEPTKQPKKVVNSRKELVPTKASTKVEAPPPTSRDTTKAKTPALPKTPSRGASKVPVEANTPADKAKKVGTTKSESKQKTVTAASKPDTPLAKKTVCISGKLPSGKKKADYSEPLSTIGYSLVDDVVNGLTYLVVADPKVSTTKSEKAKSLGVKIISEKQLIKMTS